MNASQLTVINAHVLYAIHEFETCEGGDTRGSCV